MKPKTIYSFLKQCVDLADIDFDELKGLTSITDQEEYDLKCIRAEIQNSLGDLKELLKRFKINYKP